MNIENELLYRDISSIPCKDCFFLRNYNGRDVCTIRNYNLIEKFPDSCKDHKYVFKKYEGFVVKCNTYELKTLRKRLLSLGYTNNANTVEDMNDSKYIYFRPIEKNFYLLIDTSGEIHQLKTSLNYFKDISIGIALKLFNTFKFGR